MRLYIYYAYINMESFSLLHFTICFLTCDGFAMNAHQIVLFVYFYFINIAVFPFLHSSTP